MAGEMPRDSTHSLNVQAVKVRTGISTETLRTWERRYGWPRPQRLPNGYRAYSEEDVALILAVKREMDTGVAAATAWQRVLSTRQRRPVVDAARSLERLCAELLTALLAFDSGRAVAVLAEAHAIYPLERVLSGLFQPTLVEIGDRWHAGAATVAQEHFATNVLRERLTAIGQGYVPQVGAATVLIGAAPGELHEIGILMLTLLLRRHGHNVIYLGQDTALDTLTGTLEQVRPRLLLLSASRLETARGLVAVAPLIARISPPRPLFLFGGRAFDGHPELAERIGGVHLAGDVAQAAVRVEQLLSGAS